MNDAKKRTTLTLPAHLLARAETVAAERHVTVSAVVAESLDETLPTRSRRRRGEDVLRLYTECFGGLTDDQLMIVSGIDLEPVKKSPRKRK